MANLRNIQFLRNATPLASLEDVKSALTTQAASALDGSVILGRYTVQTGSSASDTEVRTIMALVYSGTTSFLLNEDEIINALDGLDYSGITTSDAAVVTNVTEADGKIAATSANVGNLKLTDYIEGDASGHVEANDTINAGIAKLQNQIDAANDKVNALDASSVSGASKVVIDVTQEDGQITATAANLIGVKLDGYQEAAATGDVATTDTLGEALGKLQKNIHEMDKAADAVAGQVVTTVSEVDGVVSETKANVKDLQLGGYAKTNDTGDIASADTINVALSKLENQIGANAISNDDHSIVVTPQANDDTDIKVNIKTGEKVILLGNDGIYTDIKISGITPSSENVREEYALIASDGATQLGSSIKVYKDSSLTNIYIGHVDDVLTNADSETHESPDTAVTNGTGDTALVYIMHLEDDMYKLAAVNVQAFLEETEFGSGVTATNHVVHGVVDPTSENNESNVAFLTVDAAGFKISGIKDAIDTKINKLDADLSGNTTHVTVGVQEVDGKITGVTVAETNIANADDLAALSAKTYTVSTSSNNSITLTESAAADGTTSIDVITDASKLKMSGYTTVTSGVVEDSQSVTEAIAALEGAFIDNEEVVSSSLNDLNDRVDELSGKTVTAITSNNGSITANINDAAGNKSYNIETTAGQISGLTAVADVEIDDGISTSGVSASDSVQTGIKNLYASLAAEIAARKAAISSTTINGSDAINVDRSESGDTVSLKLDDSTQGTGSENTNGVNALTITDGGLFLSTKWDCGTFDENA